MISCWFFMGSCFVLTVCVVFVSGFFPFVVLVVSFLKSQIVWFGFVFQFFGVLWFLF